MKKTLVIITGTGRSRSHSFANWLNSMYDTYILHEGGDPSETGFALYRLKKFFWGVCLGGSSEHVYLWTGDLEYKLNHLEQLIRRPEKIVGDTGMFYFGDDENENVLESIVQRFGNRSDLNLRIIFLERNKDAVVKSFLRRSLDLRPNAHYRNIPLLTQFVKMCRVNFPEIEAESPAKALGMYHDYFSIVGQQFVDDHKDISLHIHVETLNDQRVRQDILKFLGHEHASTDSLHMLPRLNTNKNYLNWLSRQAVGNPSEWPHL